jgi:ElaB/YqjD/DUF883 family membrane-anchored ribosome-binding protein
MVEASIDAEQAEDGPLVTAARGVERTIGIAKEGMSQAKTKVGETATRAKEGVKEIPKKSIGELADSVTDYAKEHPGQTILVSLGVGALLGMLLSRR